jgi:hypothetical protein
VRRLIGRSLPTRLRELGFASHSSADGYGNRVASGGGELGFLEEAREENRRGDARGVRPVYAPARSQMPIRWSGSLRNWDSVSAVRLNSPHNDIAISGRIE